MGGPRPKIASANDLRNRATFTAEIAPGIIFKLKRLSMMDLVINKLLPLNMLQAATKFEKIQRNAELGLASDDPDTQAKAITDLAGNMEFKETTEFLRAYALAVVVEPKLVKEDDGKEDHLPVDALSTEELIGIFYASPERKEQAPITREAAEDFRGPEPRPAAPVLPLSEGVRPSTQLVDTPEREYITA